MLRALPTRFFLACLMWALAASFAASEPARTLFAAASLGDALAEILKEDDVRVSLGGSGAIARQIDNGAPGDAVMLANPVWMDWLDSRGHLRAGTRSAPIANRLVLVGPPGAPPLPGLTRTALLDRLGPEGRLAMGEHRSVPAGQYAQDWLSRKGLWDALRPRLAETDNVRAALALVARAEVPLAIVYASDLVAAPQAASPVWHIPPEDQPRIRYALAALTPKGDALIAALQTPEALEVFRRFGFETAP
ncbi:molybdate ABC transporter substrate-binding protein [Aliishimia ponticola]|uniref:Molybdate ABC transporter substrate-binding protein n=1 Tax=Aliishimia ponticola TaxID=2499833 RepID=A0A4S4NCY7_9RHOB|nr:molybdate ABC transporter substrate-binding protein [Aliishimia ponticola]THH37269.1 molybdate ABC transporter substrate-binding protein [Aliishimia ponticola]